MTVSKCVDLCVNRTSLYVQTPGCFNEKTFTPSFKYVASLSQGDSPAPDLSVKSAIPNNTVSCNKKLAEFSADTTLL